MLQEQDLGNTQGSNAREKGTAWLEVALHSPGLKEVYYQLALLLGVAPYLNLGEAQCVWPELMSHWKGRERQWQRQKDPHYLSLGKSQQIFHSQVQLQQLLRELDRDLHHTPFFHAVPQQTTKQLKIAQCISQGSFVAELRISPRELGGFQQQQHQLS